MLVGWASGASSDLGPLLPAICLSSSSGWFRGEAGRISLLLASLAGSGGLHGLSDGFLPAFLKGSG